MADLISSSDDSDVSSGSNHSEDASPAADAYTEAYGLTDDRKGKGPT